MSAEKPSEILFYNEGSVDELIHATLDRFGGEFDGKPAELLAVGPGRVNLIGEHTDYNFGFVMPLAIPLVTVVAGRRRDDQLCRIVSEKFSADGQGRVEFRLDQKEDISQTPKWAHYVQGVMCNFPGKLTAGFDALIMSSVPLGGGLSSSASLEVAFFTFLELFLGQIVNDVWTKIFACQKAEHDFAGVPCGVMDQFIATLGQRNHVLLLDCQSMKHEELPMKQPADPDEHVCILVTNSNVKHSLADGFYAAVRDGCFEAAQRLGKANLRHCQMPDVETAGDRLDDRLKRLARHVISENDRTVVAAGLLRSDSVNFTELGSLMNESHQSLRDDYRVSCTELDFLVETAQKCDGVFGSRMTGGGFGGCTVSLCRQKEVDHVVSTLRSAYTAKFAIQPSFFVCRPYCGAFSKDLV